MGARTNFELKDSQGSIWLYSHWGGDSKVRDLANALEVAKPRWGDVPYAIRIVVSQIIGNDWNSETGYGLTSYFASEEQYEPISADFETNRIEYRGQLYSFDEFIEIAKVVA